MTLKQNFCFKDILKFVSYGGKKHNIVVVIFSRPVFFFIKVAT